MRVSVVMMSVFRMATQDCEVRRLARSHLAPVCFRSSLAGQGGCQLRWVSSSACSLSFRLERVLPRLIRLAVLLLCMPALVDTKDVAASKKDRSGWPPLAQGKLSAHLHAAQSDTMDDCSTPLLHSAHTPLVACRAGPSGRLRVIAVLKIDQSNPNAAASPSPNPHLTKLTTA